MGTTELIRSSIARMPQGAVFSSADFLSVGTRAAVDQALLRMKKAGQIVRVARGLYAVATDVATDAVALAVAHKTGEHVGAALVTPSSAVPVVPTSGQTRMVKAGGRLVQFKRMSQRKIELASSPKGRVLLDLWGRGAKNLTTLEVRRATADWAEDEVDQFARLIPEWLRAAIKQSNAQRKSVKLGLSGAYDWSSTQIKDHVLIAKVLEKHKFEDVVRVCLFYGVPRVKRVFRQHDYGQMTRASVSRMLSNISKGLKQEADHAQA